MLTPRSRRTALHLLFFASGGLGLVYEVLWMRRFTALFGGTALAGAVTLAAFFLGLAGGSAVFGARSRSWSRPLRAFGLLEIGVGLGALATLAILELHRLVYPTVLAALGGSAPLVLAAKLVLAFVAIGLPAFCMGGTLPALAETLAPSRGGLGQPVGGLYAANLAGAVAGTLSVPFVLLPQLGANGASVAAVLGSLLVGGAAAALGGRSEREPVTAPAASDVPRSTLGLSAFSGAGTLSLQVLWTRAFALVHENSTQAFAVIVAVFLVGLACGAALARAMLRRGWDARTLLGIAWSVAGLCVLTSPFVFVRLTHGLAYLEAPSWAAVLGRLAGLAALTMLPATIALGMALPLLMETIGTRDQAGPATGRLVAVNTLGAIVGPLVAIFVLAPLLGLWRSMAVIGASVTLLGAFVLPRLRVAAAVAGLAGLAALAGSGLPPVRVRADRGERLVSVREGSYGTSAVIEDAADRWVTVNNAYVLGGTAAAEEERWQAHLPLLLHPSPRRVAFLGLGTGITAGASLRHPVQRLVALEIVPEVVEAARTDFAEENAHVLDDARVRVIADDGRHFLAATPDAFDVIVQDLLVPWRPGEAPLYAREHLLAARRALAPGGLFCQWLPAYQLSDDQLRIALATFAEVFPATTVWRGNFIPGQETLALVGHREALDAAAVDERVRAFARTAGDAHPFLRHPAGLWLYLAGPAPPLAEARRNTDARPWLELLGAAAHAEGRLAAGGGLEGLLRDAAAQPLAGTPLAGLSSDQQAWRSTGMALATARRTPGADGEAQVLDLLRTLPRELREALGVDP